MRDGLLKGFDRAYDGQPRAADHRQPLRVLERRHLHAGRRGGRSRTSAPSPSVRCVSFQQLADWLDAQDPQTLAKLRTLDVGEAPKEGWASFLTGRSPAPAPKRRARRRRRSGSSSRSSRQAG